MIKTYFGKSVQWLDTWVGIVMIGPRQDLMTRADSGRKILCAFEIEVRYPWYLNVHSDWREILRRQPSE